MCAVFEGVLRRSLEERGRATSRGRRGVSGEELFDWNDTNDFTVAPYIVVFIVVVPAAAAVAVALTAAVAGAGAVAVAVAVPVAVAVAVAVAVPVIVWYQSSSNIKVDSGLFISSECEFLTYTTPNSRHSFGLDEAESSKENLRPPTEISISVIRLSNLLNISAALDYTIDAVVCTR